MKGTGKPRAGMARMACVLGGLAAICWSQFAWMRATNFGGWDEWLIVSLTSRGIVSIPYANRPFELLWDLPPAFLMPNDLGGYLVVHATYIGLSGFLVSCLCLLLSKGHWLLAFLAGAFSIVWTPKDFLRLNAVETVAYSGATCATLLAVVLFMESWSRASPAMLALAGLLACLAARSYESTTPILLASPLLLLFTQGERTGRFWVWIVAWEAVVVALLCLITFPILSPAGHGSYQTSALGIDLRPRNVLGRLMRQYGYHLLPLVRTPLRELAVPAVPIALGVFGLACFGVVRSSPPEVERKGLRGTIGGLILMGALLAGLGYGLFVLSPAISSAARTQFLSSPGIGLLLASSIWFLATWVPVRWRGVAGIVVGAWVVALGTGRTVAMQGDWDRASYWREQNGTLLQLTQQAPDLRANTLVVLIDEPEAWPAVFTFRHAVEYLYEGRSTGHVWKANDFLYSARFTQAGVRCEPWDLIRAGWSTWPTVHRYEEVIVARLAADRRLEILDRWPHDVLPPLPQGARYAPRERILRGRPTPSSRRILVLDP